MDSRNTFKGRWKRIKDTPQEISKIGEAHGSREVSPTGLIAYVLDALCLPFQVFLRGRMGKNYFTYPKFALSSLFFLLCLSLIQFRFSTDAYLGPFTPGGIRPIPHIKLPYFLDFLESLRKAFEIWMNSFTPDTKHIFKSLGNEHSLIYKSIALYYLVANARFWISKISDRLTDPAHSDSSGEPLLLGFIPVWKWIGAYHIAYLFNFKTDVVKQYLEPVTLYLIAQYLLKEENNPSTDVIFIGICCFFASILMAIQAFVRSLPARRENDAMQSARFRNEAREAHMDQFEIFSTEVPRTRRIRGAVTRQSKN